MSIAAEVMLQGRRKPGLQEGDLAVVVRPHEPIGPDEKHRTKGIRPTISIDISHIDPKTTQLHIDVLKVRMPSIDGRASRGRRSSTGLLTDTMGVLVATNDTSGFKKVGTGLSVPGFSRDLVGGEGDPTASVLQDRGVEIYLVAQERRTPIEDILAADVFTPGQLTFDVFRPDDPRPRPRPGSQFHRLLTLPVERAAPPEKKHGPVATGRDQHRHPNESGPRGRQGPRFSTARSNWSIKP